MIKTGIRISLISLLLAFVETSYFGWNLYPASNAKIIADTICGLGMSVGLIIYLIGILRYYYNKTD